MAEIKIAPSILAADASKLGEEIKEVENAGISILHIDIMDGRFVPNLSFGPGIVKSIRKTTDMVFDVHLMLENPLDYIKAFADAGADIITVHIEAKSDVQKCIDEIHALGKKAGIVINPDTPYTACLPYIDKVEMILVMSVYPGFGGQKFIPDVLEKVKKLRELNSKIDIEIDGGINAETGRQAADAGANILVAGSSVFSAENKAEAIKEMSR